MGHHENHAAFSYAVSPFNQSDKPVMITVLDGFGDAGAISLYVAERGQLKRLRSNESLCDSLGCFYSIISSTQGGWTVLSSEGRYMGAVAWGDGDRLTNPYYRRLRQIFHFGEEGQVRVNRMLANWHNGGERDSYTQLLREIIGDPIPPEKMWNPDAVLRVEETQHAVPSHERVDLAAATQLVFEDALFHVVDHLIRTTGSDQLVLTGGTALNCLANMHLVDRYDEEWYRRNLGKRTRLHVWVPPTPGDAGVAMGAAYNFALRAGAHPGPALKHAFWCGSAPAAKEIASALQMDAEIEYRTLGNIRDPDQQTRIADLMARIVAEDGVVGLFQGPAETGPRALGHRSILANPCNPRTLETINLRVKFREPIRPLAPMATLAAARHFFELSAGGSDDHYNAYHYMVLTAQGAARRVQQNSRRGPQGWNWARADRARRTRPFYVRLSQGDGAPAGSRGVRQHFSQRRQPDRANPLSGASGAETREGPERLGAHRRRWPSLVRMACRCPLPRSRQEMDCATCHGRHGVMLRIATSHHSARAWGKESARSSRYRHEVVFSNHEAEPAREGCRNDVRAGDRSR